MDVIPSTNTHVARTDEFASHIRASYSRLALITDPAQLARIDDDYDDTLVVSCDWLLWQKALAAQMHVVYYCIAVLLHLCTTASLYLL